MLPWKSAIIARGTVVILDENALGGTIKVLILATSQRPEKSDQPKPTKKQRDGDQEKQHRHGVATFSNAARPPCALAVSSFGARSLSALAMTRIEETDMAMAATSGVT